MVNKKLCFFCIKIRAENICRITTVKITLLSLFPLPPVIWSPLSLCPPISLDPPLSRVKIRGGGGRERERGPFYPNSLSLISLITEAPRWSVEFENQFVYFFAKGNITLHVPNYLCSLFWVCWFLDLGVELLNIILGLFFECKFYAGLLFCVGSVSVNLLKNQFDCVISI